ncbi:hypothetical protein CEXT_754951 [Caerostris extrusa]|uniref:Uncharacterized protein n=1 Tax=Caerostris extrusa TaxID=172846 RepID=A0AAV4V3W9_CAEEX|nr:hypothetical protein CEXT_754951 [Caerostris extrusa]
MTISRFISSSKNYDQKKTSTIKPDGVPELSITLAVVQSPSLNFLPEFFGIGGCKKHYLVGERIKIRKVKTLFRFWVHRYVVIRE